MGYDIAYRIWCTLYNYFTEHTQEIQFTRSLYLYGCLWKGITHIEYNVHIGMRDLSLLQWCTELIYMVEWEFLKYYNFKGWLPTLNQTIEQISLCSLLVHYFHWPRQRHQKDYWRMLIPLDLTSRFLAVPRLNYQNLFPCLSLQCL